MEQQKPVVLILDDVMDNIKVLGSLLGRHKYSLLLATSGEQAIHLALENKPDLMLLDVMVPDLDGLSVCRQLKQEAQLKNVPVIFLTAKTDAEDISSGYAAGGADYITKPFHGEELRARVQTQIELKALKDRLAKLEEFSLKSKHLLQFGGTEEERLACLRLLEDLAPEGK